MVIGLGKGVYHKVIPGSSFWARFCWCMTPSTILIHERGFGDRYVSVLVSACSLWCVFSIG